MDDYQLNDALINDLPSLDKNDLLIHLHSQIMIPHFTSLADGMTNKSINLIKFELSERFKMTDEQIVNELKRIGKEL